MNFKEKDRGLPVVGNFAFFQNLFWYGLSNLILEK